MIAKTKFKGFYVILSLERYSDIGVTNVRYSDIVKNLLKKKKGYRTDVEAETINSTFRMMRKLVFPELDPIELKKLMRAECLTFDSETMGSLTLEYGLLNAKSYSYSEQTEYVNAYVSTLWDFENYENVEVESTCMKKNYAFQQESENKIHELIQDEDWAELSNYLENLEFQFDLSQLEIDFENETRKIN